MTQATEPDQILPTEKDESPQKTSSNIMVAVRMRPLWKNEIDNNEVSIIKILDEKLVILRDPQDFDDDQIKNELRKNRSREKRYAFDYAFDESTPTDRVFQLTAQNLCVQVLDGFNSTVFAYGATGAGKTHTMLGSAEQPGIMFQTMRELFKTKDEFDDREYIVKISFLEIYNEQIKDLISEQPLQQSPMIGSKPNEEELHNYHELREDPIKGVCIANITEKEVQSAEQILSLLLQGNLRRTVEATGANATSSRSHAVMQITTEFTNKHAGIQGDLVVGKLSLIDLAGSERASRTNNRGMRMIEGANINKSLLALGNCINALHENHTSGKSNYVPYRDSKLTRLLKDSLGGNCQTVMIANIGPSIKHFEDTHNTLKYANRAKNIKTSAQKNILNVQYHVSQYTDIISKLKLEVQDLKSQLGKNGSRPPRQLNPNQNSQAQLSLPPISGDQNKSRDFETHKQQLQQSLDEELDLQKKTQEIEDKIATNNLKVTSKQLEMDSVRQSDPAKHKALQDELEGLEKLKKSFEDQIEDLGLLAEAISQAQAKQKQQWAINDVLSVMEKQMLQMTARENQLKVQNSNMAHKLKMQDLKIKHGQLQQQRLIEQLKLRDEIILAAQKYVSHKSQQNGADIPEVALMAKDLAHILQDERIVPADEVVKRNAQMLPPIQLSASKRAKNSPSLQVPIARGQRNNSRQQQYSNASHQNQVGRIQQLQLDSSSNHQHQRANLQSSNTRVVNLSNINKHLLDKKQSTEGIMIQRDQITLNGQSSATNHQNIQKLMPSTTGSASPRIIGTRNQTHDARPSQQILGEASGVSLKAPLYMNVQSKIGSGVIQPFSYQQSLINKQQVQFRNNSGIQNSRRVRLGPGSANKGSYTALISQKNSQAQAQQQHLSPDQLNQLNDAKIRSSSVVSTGDSAKQRGLLIPSVNKQRRIASGTHAGQQDKPYAVRIGDSAHRKFKQSREDQQTKSLKDLKVTLSKEELTQDTIRSPTKF